MYVIHTCIRPDWKRSKQVVIFFNYFKVCVIFCTDHNNMLYILYMPLFFYVRDLPAVSYLDMTSHFVIIDLLTRGCHNVIYSIVIHVTTQSSHGSIKPPGNTCMSSVVTIKAYLQKTIDLQDNVWTSSHDANIVMSIWYINSLTINLSCKTFLL